MDASFKYRGKVLSADDIGFINRLIGENPDASRWVLSRKLCRVWNWVQPNGTLKDMVCRSMMLELHRAGHIHLPAKKRDMPNPLSDRRSPGKFTVDQSPVEGPLSKLIPLQFRQVRRSPEEKVFNSLVEQFHYLGYCHPVGEQLKYLVYSRQRPIACLAWSSAPRHIGCRDRYIGWSKRLRKAHIHLLAYNSRFLILPWVGVMHLASHILGRMARILSEDWRTVYNHPIYYLETFVDKQRLLCVS